MDTTCEFSNHTSSAVNSILRFAFISISVLIIVVGIKESALAATQTVSAGGNLQAAINAAQPGDTIILEAGASFTGPFLLPAKAGTGTDADYITIQSSRLSELPEGVRIRPEQSSLMPKLLAPGSNTPALRTEGVAHHWRLLGLEFVPVSASAAVSNVIEFGDDGSRGQNSLDRVPHNLVLDRCFIHAFPDQDAIRGVALNSAYSDVMNCYIADFKSNRTDSQAIFGWNGPGPFRVINNYLEGASESLQFGLSTSIPDLVPSDIEIRRNHLTKKLAWRGVWLVKNLFELKSARRVVFDGNLLENNWADGQVGYAVQLTVRNQYNNNPWATIQDVQFTNNIIRNSSAAINILGKDDPSRPSQQARRITIRNNLAYNLGSGPWGGADGFLQITDTDSVTVDHNTALQTGSITEAYGPANTNFVFTNNVTPHNQYGIFGGGSSPGNSTIAAYFPGGRFQRNVIWGDGPYSGSSGWGEVYPADNFYPRIIDAVGFLGFATANYRLAATSVYKGQSTDGKDVGCNFDALDAALAGVSTPVPPTPTPTPLPTPLPTPVPTPTPLPTPTPPPGGEQVWVDDALPAGSILGTGIDTMGWQWLSSSPSPYSGTRAHTSNAATGTHQHYFYGATQRLAVNTGDRLFAYVYLDPQNMPQEVMLQWNDGTWDHRAYWGANRINFGTDGSNSRRYMGGLPAAGGWVKLEVAASLVGLEGKNINGMAFTLFGGRATWDRAGKSSNSTSTSPPPGVNAPSIFTMPAGDAIALNAYTGAAGAFDVTTFMPMANDQRTRLMVSAANLGAAPNTDGSNDVLGAANEVFVNLAESVRVEARVVRDGRVINLPVEYAGRSFSLNGLDQINLVLLPELRGVGGVELTLIITGGGRSNTASIAIR